MVAVLAHPAAPLKSISACHVGLYSYYIQQGVCNIHGYGIILTCSEKKPPVGSFHFS